MRVLLCEGIPLYCGNMTAKRAPFLDIDPIETMTEHDAGECLREAARALAMGGLDEAARYVRMAAEIMDAHKRAH